MCIQTGKTMSDTQRMKFATDQFYFKTAEEMAQVFRELPDAVSRTVAIADRCNVKIQRVSNPFPEFKVPEGYTTDSYFEKVVREGFAVARDAARAAGEGEFACGIRSRSTRAADGRNRNDQEDALRGLLPDRLGFHSLRARARDVPVGPGRGSAAGSLVSYALRITDVDPLQYDLLFERFLNPERISMPDIDIDFCMRRRGEVIEYVRKTYGEKSVAQIITFGTMAAKAALKDTGRALDMPYGDVDRLAKLVPNQLNISLDEALKQSPQLESMREKDEQREGSRRGGAAAGRAGAARFDARGGSGDFAAAAHGNRAAVQVEQGRNHDAVRHERARAHRPAEDGFSGPDDADRSRRCRSA